MSDRTRYEPKRLIAASLRAIVRDLDVAWLSVPDAVALVDWFAGIERLAAAGKTIAAGRAAEGEPWRDTGDRSAADWLAKRTGSSVGAARSTLDTAAHLPDAPATGAAFRRGALSPAQAEAIASAAAVDPDREVELVGAAGHVSLKKLRDECARVRAAAEPDPTARHERIRKARFWRRWTRVDGSRAGMYAGTPEEVALIEAAAQPFIDARLDEARRSGEHEPSDAYAFDGLAAMAASTMTTSDDSDDPGDPDERAAADADAGGPPDGPPTPPSTRPPRGGRGRRRLQARRELIALVDLAALQRGQVEPGETCEIAGVGPVPVEVARRMFGDALLRIVIRDGVDIRTVVHTGRTANAVQETAILVRQDGCCARPRCDLAISEIDHHAGFTATRVTTLDDLNGLCGHDHDLKTRYGHTYHRTPDGRIEWIRPDGTIECERPPPEPDG